MYAGLYTSSKTIMYIKYSQICTIILNAKEMCRFIQLVVICNEIKMKSTERLMKKSLDT